MAVVSKKKLLNMGDAFVENVVSMHREEVFGLKGCSDVSWECLYKDYMILVSLEAHSGTVYNQEDINCLYNKVTNVKC